MPSTLVRLLSKVQTGPGCWEWQGFVGTHGYGVFNRTPAHRVAYREMVGPIPRGLVIDHLCENKLCVRPDHLRVTTHAENILRGSGTSARNLRKTHCVNGHAFDSANTYWYKGRWRQCRKCRAEAANRRYHRLKQDASPGQRYAPTRSVLVEPA